MFILFYWEGGRFFARSVREGGGGGGGCCDGNNEERDNCLLNEVVHRLFSLGGFYWGGGGGYSFWSRDGCYVCMCTVFGGFEMLGCTTRRGEFVVSGEAWSKSRELGGDLDYGRQKRSDPRDTDE